MRIDPEKIFEIQGSVAKIKQQAQDRNAILEECDKISKTLKKVIEDGIQR